MVTVKPGDAEAAIKNACVFLSDMHLRRLEGRDITFLFVADALLRGATPEKRICAIGLLEAKLYPDGCPWGSLSKTLGVSLNKRKPRKPGADALAYGTRDISVANAVRITSRDFGFRPTRNRAARDTEGAESACSIVSSPRHPYVRRCSREKLAAREQDYHDVARRIGETGSARLAPRVGNKSVFMLYDALLNFAYPKRSRICSGAHLHVEATYPRLRGRRTPWPPCLYTHALGA
jgi:hypothetical protein